MEEKEHDLKVSFNGKLEQAFYHSKGNPMEDIKIELNGIDLINQATQTCLEDEISFLNKIIPHTCCDYQDFQEDTTCLLCKSIQKRLEELKAKVGK